MVPQPDGYIHPIPVFVLSKRKQNNTYNWNTEHPYYQNWRGMVSRGLDQTSPDYASVRVNPAFIGFRNNEADIRHYDKYAFFAYVRAIDFFIGHKPGYNADTENAVGAEFNTNAAMHYYHMDRISPRYHYTISNMRWLPDSDNTYEKYSSQ